MKLSMVIMLLGFILSTLYEYQ